MEPFTLIIWLVMGQRFEETRIENLGRGECVEQAIAIEADRAQMRIQCIDGRRRVVFPREITTPPVCAHASWCHGGTTLPGRRRI